MRRLSVCGWVLVPAMLAFSVACSEDSTKGPAQPDGGTTGSDATTGNNGVLEGVVTNAAGETVGDVTIKVGALTATADYQGVYKVDNVPPGAVAVDFAADWYSDRQEQAEIKAGETTKLDVVLAARPLQIDDADRALAETYNQSYDWTKASLSIRTVAAATRRGIESAVYWLNPAFYRDRSAVAKLAPAPAPTVDGTGGKNFDFTVDGKPVLVEATIADNLEQTPLSPTAKQDFFMWPAVEKAMETVLTIRNAGAAVRQQQWGGQEPNPQKLERVFVDNGEIWVEVAFDTFVELGTGVSDSNGDGRLEIFAKLSPDLYTAADLKAITEDYTTKALDTLGVREVIDDLINVLYDRTNPEIVGTLGNPYEAEGVGTIKYPCVVLKHGDPEVVNVLLVRGQ